MILLRAARLRRDESSYALRGSGVTRDIGKLKNWEIETCRNREMQKKEKVEKLRFFKKDYKHLMTRSNLPVDFDGQAVAEFCKLRGIRRLSLFGSAVRDDYRPGESDLDVFAEFEPGALRGVGLDFFAYGSDLEKILGGKVDFCSKLNKYIKPLVEKECVPLYEQV